MEGAHYDDWGASPAFFRSPRLQRGEAGGSGEERRLWVGDVGRQRLISLSVTVGAFDQCLSCTASLTARVAAQAWHPSLIRRQRRCTRRQHAVISPQCGSSSSRRALPGAR